MTRHDMPEAFAILARFLERHAEEVAGRAEEDPPVEIQNQLRLFARGDLSEPELDALVRLLRDHPAWVRFLAEEIKALRNEPEDTKGD